VYHRISLRRMESFPDWGVLGSTMSAVGEKESRGRLTRVKATLNMGPKDAPC
jgi:hypothetical protein